MPDQENLAKRELEIARAYADGLSHKDIAEKLFIAPATVHTHINNIYRKLGVKTKMQLLKKTASTDTPEQPKRKFAAFRYAVAGAVALGIMVIGLAVAPGKHTIADAPEPPWKTGLIGPADGALGAIRENEVDRVERMPKENLVAYDHFLKGMLLLETYGKDETARAIEEFDRAVEPDPRYGRAHAYAGWAYLQQFRNGWSTSPEQSLLEAEHRANVAIEVDPSDPYGHWSMGAIRLYQRRHNQSHDAYQRAITLNPSNAEMLIQYGWSLAYAGQPDKAIAYLDGAMQRNP